MQSVVRTSKLARAPFLVPFPETSEYSGGPLQLLFMGCRVIAQQDVGILGKGVAVSRKKNIQTPC